MTVADRLCDCANTSAFCLHDGKPGPRVACMARDPWHEPGHLPPPPYEPPIEEDEPFNFAECFRDMARSTR